MAPEVVRHEPYNSLCDVYSFGMLGWEMMTYTLPFADVEPVQVRGMSIGRRDHRCRRRRRRHFHHQQQKKQKHHAHSRTQAALAVATRALKPEIPARCAGAEWAPLSALLEATWEHDPDLRPSAVRTPAAARPNAPHPTPGPTGNAVRAWRCAHDSHASGGASARARELREAAATWRVSGASAAGWFGGEDYAAPRRRGGGRSLRGQRAQARVLGRRRERRRGRDEAVTLD